MNRIFIQCASYRDPELVMTIKSALENATYPENLVFSIARQFHPDDGFDDLTVYDNDKRFRILNIPYNESQGVCWARNLTQQLYEGEEFTLQVDSHMRFGDGWDVELIEMINHLQNKGYNKPLLTSYVPSYNPDNDPGERVRVPWRMTFDRFIPEGPVFFLPESIPNWESLTEPVPSRFYSGHFCFTLGDFAKEVQHDPLQYFHGEEIAIAVRAYTHGYDLFHPHKPIIWHEYTRKGRTKQWDDDKTWGIKNTLSHQRTRKLLSMDGESYNEEEFGDFGLGKTRTLRDYEIYSGIHFKNRAVQQYTLDKGYPPNPYPYDTEKEWENSFSRIFKHCIDLNKSSVPLSDYTFWAVIFEDENGISLNRLDLTQNDIKSLLRSSGEFCKIWREFLTVRQPKKWIVWPYSSSIGWCDRIEGLL